MFDILAGEYTSKGGDAPGSSVLPGGATVTSGNDPDGIPYGGGRADIRLAVDGDGELYVLSKSDGMIRKLVAVAVCGDGLVEGTEQCDLGAKNGQVGVCCSAICRLKPTDAVCRRATGACDVAESRTGTSPYCPANGFKVAGAVCRPAAGVCDVAEACIGTSPSCPANGFQPNGTLCDDDNPATCHDQCTAGSCAGTSC